MDDADTSGGTLYDSSAYDNHGTINGGVTTSVSGKIGYAFDFDGSEGTGITMGLSSPPPTTLCGWVNLDSTSAEAVVVNNPGFRGQNLYVQSGDAIAEVILDNNDNSIQARSSVSTGNWYHLVAVLDSNSGQVELYVNGQEKSSQSWDGTYDGDSNIDNIGTDELNAPEQPLDGKIDDVRVYNRALSANEVRALYNMRSQRQQNAIGLPHTQNLLLHLNARNKLSVDESNNRWYDISGNNYEAHGTDGDGSINDNNFPDWEAKNGGRFILNGSEGWNVPGPIDTSGQVTLESWFYRTDLSSDAEYLSDARNGTGDWHLTNYQGYNVNFHNDLKMNDPSGGDYRDTEATSSPSSNLFNRWTHLVATSDGNISEIYIDGEKITDNKLQRDNPFPTGIGSDFAIANRYTGSAHLQGYMSVYRIYDTVLSTQQVKTNYESEKKYYR